MFKRKGGLFVLYSLAPKTKASFNLDAATYISLKALAESRKVSKSTLVDAVMADLLERFAADGFQVATVVPAKKTRRKIKNELNS